MRNLRAGVMGCGALDRGWKSKESTDRSSGSARAVTGSRSPRPGRVRSQDARRIPPECAGCHPPLEKAHPSSCRFCTFRQTLIGGKRGPEGISVGARGAHIAGEAVEVRRSVEIDLNGKCMARGRTAQGGERRGGVHHRMRDLPGPARRIGMPANKKNGNAG